MLVCGSSRCIQRSHIPSRAYRCLYHCLQFCLHPFFSCSRLSVHTQEVSSGYNITVVDELCPTDSIWCLRFGSLMHSHTCQPGRGQMTEIFPIGDAHSLTGSGRRACTTQSVTAVAHLNISLLSHIISHRGKDEAFSHIFIADLRTYVKQLILSER